MQRRTDQAPPVGTPVAEFGITGDLVSALLRDQHPDLLGPELRLVGEGWDNAIFRLGDDLAVRLPRRAAVAHLISHEQTWLPQLAAKLPIPVPSPCRIGVPACGYPWRWSVMPWLAGRPADEHAPARSEARALGKFLKALHVPAPPNAPRNPVRGVALLERAASVEHRIKRLGDAGKLISPQVTQIWEAGVNASIDVATTWLHGDLHPRNVLVEHGAISGIIDWGDMSSGDCATDLASIWMLFEECQARDEFRSSYGDISEATLHRAKAWAVLFGVFLLDTGLADNPRNAQLGKKILQQVC